MQLSLLASTPDVSTTGYMVNLLLGRPEAVAAEAVAWVRRLDHPGFGLMLDTHQLLKKEPSVVEGIRAAAGLLRHLHLYDPGRVPPGTSEKAGLDWSAVMAALQDIQYEGAASVSLAPTGDRRALAMKTVSYLRSLMPA